MIEELAKAMAAVGIELDWRELADILWLSHVTEPFPSTLGTDDRSIVTRDEAEGPQTTPVTSEASESTSDAIPDTWEFTLQPRDDLSGDLVLDARGPVGYASPGTVQIGRALLPFKRSRPATNEQAFDVDATIDHYCATKVLAPITVPIKERWFHEVAMVVDGGPTMAPWRETVTALAELLERYGAFDRVTRWTLVGDDNEIYIESTAGLQRKADEFVDFRGRRATLVITDCVGALWRAPAVWAALDGWGRFAPVALLQTLPARLWSATAMGEADVVITSDKRGAANQQLRLRSPWWWDERLPPQQATPVITLDTNRLGAWARVVMGAGTETVSGVVTRPPALVAPQVDTPPANAHLRVAAFRTTVSEEAALLATLLSVTEVNMPVAQLILDTLIPDPRPTYLAEVLVSGLLQLSSTAEDSPNIDNFDFVPGVREVLRESLTTSAAFDVWRTVAPYLEAATGRRPPFSALLSPGAEPSADASAIEYMTVDLIEDLGLTGPIRTTIVRSTPSGLSPAALGAGLSIDMERLIRPQRLQARGPDRDEGFEKPVVRERPVRVLYQYADVRGGVIGASNLINEEAIVQL